MTSNQVQKYSRQPPLTKPNGPDHV